MGHVHRVSGAAATGLREHVHGREGCNPLAVHEVQVTGIGVQLQQIQALQMLDCAAAALCVALLCARGAGSPSQRGDERVLVEVDVGGVRVGVDRLLEDDLDAFGHDGHFEHLAEGGAHAVLPADMALVVRGSGDDDALCCDDGRRHQHLDGGSAHEEPEVEVDDQHHTPEGAQEAAGPVRGLLHGGLQNLQRKRVV